MMAPSYHSDTIPTFLKYWADVQPEKPAFVFLSRDGTRTSITSKQIYHKSLKFAENLRELGIEPGDVVCNMIQDGAGCTVAVFGSLCAGCIVQNGVVQMADGKFLVANMNQTKCRAVFLSSKPGDPATRILTECFDAVDGNTVSSNRLPHLKYVVYTSTSEHGGFQWPLTNRRGQKEIESTMNGVTSVEFKGKGDDTAFIASTSGTTGFSKLIMAPHRNVLGYRVVDIMKKYSYNFRPSYKVFDPHPITWLWGFPFPYFELGCTMVNIEQRVVNDDGYIRYMRDAILNEKCQVAKLSPKDSFAMIELNNKEGIQRSDWPLEAILMAGQPLTEPALRLTADLADYLFNVYGSSEQGLVGAKMMNRESGFEGFNVGYVVDGIAVKIADSENRNVRDGEFGELFVKTPAIFSGYFGEPEVTKTCFTDDGWYRTRDMAKLNDVGELVVLGRMDDAIMRGQSYFHPLWIENIIRKCPGVADVMVVKVHDPIQLHEICACVVPEDHATDIETKVEAFCSREFLNLDTGDKSARPGYYIKMESLPVNRNRKPDRKQVEKMAADFLKLDPVT